MSVKLFTYGTLRPSLYPSVVEHHNMTVIGPGKVEGFKMFDLGYFPAIVKGEGTIKGELVEVPDLSAIDYYEGYREGGRGLYDRREVEVTLDDNTSDKALVYFMKQVPASADPVESGDWANGEGRLR